MRLAHARVLERAYDSVFNECYKPAVELLRAAQEEIDAELAALLAAGADVVWNMGIEMALREAAAQRGALEARIAKLTAALANRDAVKAQLGDARWRRGNPNSAFGLMAQELRAATALRDKEAALDMDLPRIPAL